MCESRWPFSVQRSIIEDRSFSPIARRGLSAAYSPLVSEIANVPQFVLLISVRCQRLSSLFGKEVNPILQMICLTYYVYARHSLATLRVQLMLLSLRRSSNCCNCSTILSSVRPYTSIWCLVYFLNGHLARRVQSWPFSCEIRGVLKDPTIRVSIGRVPCWWETRCRPCTPRLRVPHYNRSLYHTAK
jgi:hypothetical protein